jgi:anti-sigma regulatory factor (Ser/Thr protein kinase)
MNNKLELTIKQGLNGVKETVEHAVRFLEKHQVTLDTFGFKLVLFEALNNAIIHGNSQNNELISSCIIEIHNDGLTIVVGNEGTGFDWREAVKGSLQSAALDDTLEEGGRGFILYRLYDYDFSFSEDGREIKLHKKFESGTI